MFLNLKIYFWFSGHPASSAPLDTQEAEISTPPPDRPAPHSPTGSGRSVELGGAPGLPAPGSYPHPSQGDWTFLFSAFFVQKLNLTFFSTFKRKLKKSIYTMSLDAVFINLDKQLFSYWIMDWFQNWTKIFLIRWRIQRLIDWLIYWYSRCTGCT